LKSKLDFRNCIEANKLAAKTLNYALELCNPGITTDEIDYLVHEYIIKNNAYPSPLNYLNYPKSTCISINNVAVHGIPNNCYKLNFGDLISIDISVYKNGYHADTCDTVIVPLNKKTEQNTDVNILQNDTEQYLKDVKLLIALDKILEVAISNITINEPVSNIGFAMETYLIENFPNYSINKEFCGHGVGEHFHMAPQIPHWSKFNSKYRILPNMVFTIEPILIDHVNSEIEISRVDGWTGITKSGQKSAQKEHTILVLENGDVKVLTRRKSERNY